MKHIPYMLIVGEKEQAEGTVTVRKQGGISEGTFSIADFGKKVESEVDEMINKL
jgi:threonyl-tRNA synthetase